MSEKTTSCERIQISIPADLASDDKLNASTPPWWHINKGLLPAKLLYLTVYMSFGCEEPMVHLYMKSLGLTVIEISVVATILPIIGLFSQPLFGYLSDRLRNHKLMLAIFFLSTALCHCLFAVVPILLPKVEPDFVDCRQNISELDLFDKFTINPLDLDCVDGNILCKSDAVEVKNNEVCNCTGITIVHRDIAFHNKTVSSSSSSTLCMSLVRNNTNIFCYFTFNTTNDDIVCVSNKAPNSRILKTSEYRMFSKLFIIVLILQIITQVCRLSIISTQSALVYSILSEESHKWGSQRMFGSIGACISVLWTSTVQDELGNRHLGYEISYFIAFLLLSTLCVYWLNVKECKTRSCYFKTSSLFTYNPKIWAFYAICFFVGVYSTALGGFVWLYLRDIQLENGNVNQKILGVILLTSLVTEIPAFRLSGAILKRLGGVNCIYLTIFGYTVRCAVLSFITDSWMAVLIAPLDGAVFSIFHVTSLSYAKSIVPDDMLATSVGTIYAIRNGLGTGVGGVVVGVLFNSVGARSTYGIFAAMSVIVLVVYVILQQFIFKSKDDNQEEQKITQAVKYKTFN